LKAALVTGGALRIGRAIALRLAREGWCVAIHCNRSLTAAETLAAEIKSAGGQAEIFSAPLDEAETPERLIKEVTARLGPLACLVNNASLFEDDRLGALSPEAWDRHIAVNVRAPVFLSQAFAAALPATRDGNIINIVDQRVWRPNPLFFSYTISKAALWTATRTMAQALSPRIRVNAIGPGPVLRSIHQSEADFAQECAAMPLGHGTSPEEIADAVMFILGAPAMTGQMIALDGGQHLMWQTPDLSVT
jgi:NAD(P)-dependent dehydrogenase (short-subunit alcohol dehydrogenase family)